MEVMEVKRKLSTAFDDWQSTVLSEVVVEAYTDLVKTSDFNELKAIVKDLAQAQRRTEQRVEELAEAQKETQQEIKKLAESQIATNKTLGGLGQSVAYALENEAYRLLPALLKEKYGIEVTARMVRKEINKEEINLFGEAYREGQPVLLVGETKLRLDERRKGRKGQKEVFEQLWTKVAMVNQAYPDREIVPLMITHYARPSILERAQEEGIIVVQSFEW